MNTPVLTHILFRSNRTQERENSVQAQVFLEEPQSSDEQPEGKLRVVQNGIQYHLSPLLCVFQTFPISFSFYYYCCCYLSLFNKFHNHPSLFTCLSETDSTTTFPLKELQRFQDSCTFIVKQNDLFIILEFSQDKSQQMISFCKRVSIELQFYTNQNEVFLSFFLSFIYIFLSHLLFNF